MNGQLEHLEELFRNLAKSGYSPNSEKSPVYNCIAYCAGDEGRKWEGYREIGYHWPEGAIEGHLLDALVSAFQQLDYGLCRDGALESGFEKVVLYADNDGLWTHAAKQREDGQWLSNLGNLEDIVHRTPEAVAGEEPAYGRIACYMKRQRSSN